MKDQWAENILCKFEDRKILTKKELFDEYFASMGLSELEVMECFDEIESDYSIPVGVLRPSDELSKLTDAAVQTSNPLKWLFWRSRSEFREADLLDELSIRLRKHGTLDDWKTIDTFEDLVLAWCGHKPRTDSAQS